MKYLRIITLCYSLCFATTLFSQKLSIESIWKTYDFYPQGIPEVKHSNNGEFFFMLQHPVIYKIPYKNKPTDTLLNYAHNLQYTAHDFVCNSAENKVLLATNITPTRRSSYIASYYEYCVNSKTTQILFDSTKQIQNPTYSPKSNKICFFYNNNLYLRIEENNIEQITFDGFKDSIINGMPDWVYEEEFELLKAFAWSPDGKHIAYLRFDERNVPSYKLPQYIYEYPIVEEYKYPKPGYPNAIVTAHIFNITQKKTYNIEITIPYEYIPEFSWIDSNNIALTLLNRAQNTIHILQYSLSSGQSKILYTHSNNSYIDIPTFFTPLADKQSFIVVNDLDGFQNIYKYNLQDESATQLTKNIGDITNIYAYIQETDELYFQATNNIPTDRYVYCLHIASGKLTQLDLRAGTQTIDINLLGTAWIFEYSNATQKLETHIQTKDGLQQRKAIENLWLEEFAKQEKFSAKEFFTISTADDEYLYAWMIKPPSFNKRKKYPVIVTVYGGPTNQKVTNDWNYEYYWHQYLAKQGYIIVAIDCRGTFGRGSEFRKQTYGKLGILESEDFAMIAYYLKSLPYVNKQKIAIQGWSYGGYMALLTSARFPNAYNAAVAIAPVTDWKLYDNIYTERYLNTPQENPEGYNQSSVFTYIDSLQCPILISHGFADDNVHIQHSLEFIRACINNGKDFDFVLFPEDNHSIGGKNSRHFLYQKIFAFYETHLK